MNSWFRCEETTDSCLKSFTFSRNSLHSFITICNCVTQSDSSLPCLSHWDLMSSLSCYRLAIERCALLTWSFLHFNVACSLVRRCNPSDARPSPSGPPLLHVYCATDALFSSLVENLKFEQFCVETFSSCKMLVALFIQTCKFSTCACKFFYVFPSIINLISSRD